MGATIESELLTTRGIRQIANIANRTTMLEHKVQRLAGRFENNALTKPGGPLGFGKRTAKYQKRKARVKHHQRPNVWSGELREKVLSSARVTATYRQAKLIARGTTTSRLRDARRAEIEAIAPSENADMQRTWIETVSQLSEQPQYQRRRRL